MLRKLFSHSMIYALGPQIPKLITISTLPLVTPKLSSNDFGIYGLLLSYVGAIQLLKDFGFNQIFFNTFFTRVRSYPLIWRNLIGILILWSIIYACLIGVITYIVVKNIDPKNALICTALFMGPALLFENTNAIGIALCRSMEKPMLIALNTGLSGLVSSVLSVILIYFFNQGYLGWLYGIAAASAISFIHFGYILYIKEKMIPIFRFKIQSLKYYLGIGLPMIPHNYSSYLLGTSDRILLDFMKTPIKEIGRYNVAYLMSSYVSLFDSIISFSSNSFYLKYFSKNEDNKVRTLTFILQVLFLDVTVSICLWFNELVGFFIRNNQYNDILLVGILLIMGFNYRPMYFAANMQLSIRGRIKPLLKISLVGGIMNVLLNIVLIQYWGILAAALTTYISLLYMGFIGFYINGFDAFLRKSYYPMLWLSLIILLTMIVYFASGTAIIYRVFLTLGIIVLNIFLFLRFRKIISKLD